MPISLRTLRCESCVHHRAYSRNQQPQEGNRYENNGSHCCATSEWQPEGVLCVVLAITAATVSAVIDGLAARSGAHPEADLPPRARGTGRAKAPRHGHPCGDLLVLESFCRKQDNAAPLGHNTLSSPAAAQSSAIPSALRDSKSIAGATRMPVTSTL